MRDFGSGRLAQALEPGSKIRLQFVHVLEPDMEPHKRSFEFPREGAVVMRREREAFETAPRIAEAEMLEPVEHGGDRVIAGIAEHDAEETACAREVALPQRMARI